MTADETPIPPSPDVDSEIGRITRSFSENIFYIGIDRPKKLNGFTPEMFREMAQAYTEYEKNDEAYCAIVFSHGPHFTAGIDLPKRAPLIQSGDREFFRRS